MPLKIRQTRTNSRHRTLKKQKKINKMRRQTKKYSSRGNKNN